VLGDRHFNKKEKVRKSEETRNVLFISSRKLDGGLSAIMIIGL